jgi:hypothetical protein
MYSYCRSQWQSALSRESKAARLLGLRFRIPPEHWCLSLVIVECWQVQFFATGLELVQRSPTDSGVLLCVWSRNFKNKAALAHVGLLRQRDKNKMCLCCKWWTPWLYSYLLPADVLSLIGKWDFDIWHPLVLSAAVNRSHPYKCNYQISFKLTCNFYNFAYFYTIDLARRWVTAVKTCRYDMMWLIILTIIKAYIHGVYYCLQLWLLNSRSDDGYTLASHLLPYISGELKFRAPYHILCDGA